MKRVLLTNLSKEFASFRRGRVEALRGVNLEIPSGHFFVLLGPSGCGKTTLLNLIAGLEQPTTGEIHIGDTLAASAEQKLSLSPRERDIAMVFQSYALYPHMTVAENIGFPLKMAGTDKDEIDKRVRSIAETLGLQTMLDARPTELSGGQRQRVALGRALVRNPGLLLLDEPLSNLDALLRIDMRAELKEMQRRLNVTTVYVTHDQAEAMAIGDTIAVLKDGQIQQVGPPTEIYEAPANLFIAKFIGSPPANVLSDKQADTVRSKFTGLLKSRPENVVMAVRPERIKIVSFEDGVLQGKVRIVSPLGSDTLIYVDSEDRQLIVRVFEKPDCRDGDRVGLAFDTPDLLFFDSSSTQRLD